MSTAQLLETQVSTTGRSANRRKPLGPRGVAAAAMIGTTIEWYDFFVYGTSVVLVLGPLFFPNENPLTASLLAFSTLGVGFLARPLGGIVFAHFGDRVGRKGAMIVSLIMMGLATVAVGLLPTFDQIGVWAPVLLVLLRFVQGLAVGGEWGGAVLISVEHAPIEKRALYGTAPQFGSPLGLLASSAIIALLQLMPADQFNAWGWRVPFLLSFVLLIVGLYMRRRLEESVVFESAKGSEKRLPLAVVWRDHRRALLTGAGICLIAHAYFIIVSFLPAYARTEFGVSVAAATWSLVIASVVALVSLAVVAPRLDGLNRRKVAMFGGLMGAIVVVPTFVAASVFGSIGLLIAVPLAYLFVQGQYAALPSLLTELFPPEVRYTGVSLCYQISAIIGGGLMPIAASYLVSRTGGSWLPAAALMIVAGLVTALAAAKAPAVVADQPSAPTDELFESQAHRTEN